MICDICHKNPAMIHIQEIGPNGRHSLNLCLKCAAERALEGQEANGGLGKFLKSIANPESAMEVLNQLGFNGESVAQLFGDRESQLKCPVCGSTWREIERSHQLGCEECLKTFQKQITGLIKPIHRAIWNTYEEKFPVADTFDTEVEDIEQAVRQHDQQQEVERLKRELACAVLNENYERAARLRDMIAEFTPENISEQTE
ncbi:MAG: UvrB/UvrC motif-containing protein [Victivallales bacterium]|nr:UvrB/UvrC motif-containing protein [Victivallales bacterium]